MRQRVIIATAFSAALMQGCLKIDFTETTPALSLNASEIVVPADLPEGSNLVTDTLVVTSNRSWSADLATDAGWVRMDTTGFHNIAEKMEMTKVVLRFDDNVAETERTATIFLYSEAGNRTVRIVQRPVKYRISIDYDPAGLEGITSDGDTLGIRIRTNSKWSVALKKGSTAGISFSKNSGSGDGSVVVSVAENEERAVKNATLVFSAKGCRDIELPLSQAQYVPYFILQDSTVVDAVDGVANTSIKIKTNTNWTAELVSAEGYDLSSIIVPAGGNKTIKSILVTHPACDQFGTVGKIVLKLTAEGVDGYQTVMIRQNPVIRVSFGELSESAMWASGAALGLADSTWPFSLPKYSDIQSSVNLTVHAEERFELLLKTGYKMYVYSTKGIWKHSKTGFMGGGTIGNYLELPAVPGLRLTKMIYTFRDNSTLTGILTDTSGNEILNSTFSVAGQGSRVTVEPEGAPVGEPCRIVFTNTTYFALGDLILYYE